MDKHTIGHIIADRLAHWASILYEEGATPFILLGVGHGPQSGTWHLCHVNLPGLEEDLPNVLRNVADRIESGGLVRHTPNPSDRRGA